MRSSRLEPFKRDNLEEGTGRGDPLRDLKDSAPAPIPERDAAGQVTRTPKVRCPQCGAKNEDVEMCRICGISLPGAVAIRNRGPGADSPGFKETIEVERAAWREHNDGTARGPIRSRRPPELPHLPPAAWADPASYVSGEWHASPEEDRAPEEQDRPGRKRRFGLFSLIA